MISKYLKKIGERSKVAALNIVKVDIKKRNKVLDVFSKEISRNKKKIINENIKDIKTCKREELIDRLLLDEKKINNIRDTIGQIIKFKDPLGKIIEKWNRPNKLTIKKITVPIGVIGVIYESRPNVTCDVSSLCLKSGNVAT
jgi:glutamate-5-semialdehyde dehydrogenase